MDAVVGASSNADGMHKFMHNNGDGTFSNATAGTGIENYLGMSVEYVSYDFNNDGFTDVLTNNTILYNNGNSTFTAVSVPMSVGAVGDINNDGFLDVQSGNTIYYNSGNSNNWLTVTLQGTTTNKNGIGARVEIYGAWGKQIRDVRAGVGFRYMGTLNTHFGIGAATQIDSVIVRWPSGTTDLICNPDKNMVLYIVENSGLAPSADFSLNSAIIFVNDTVEFTDASSPCPSDWNWTVDPANGWEFSNGTSATSQNPEITFNNSGTYIVSLVSSNTNGSSTNVSSDTITVNLTVGIAQNKNSDFSLYPNPAEDVVNINIKTASINSVKIISVVGAEIEADFNRSNNTIEVSHLKPGIYLLSITTGSGEVVVTKFTKK
jgi:PKD repeat protein